MTARRTVTVHTLDHGDVPVLEPAWCLGQHDAQHGGYRADIVHNGPDTSLVYDGHSLLTAAIAMYPFAELLPVGPLLTVDLGDGWHGFPTPDAVRDFADALTGHSRVLYALADELDAAQRGTNRSE